jgi:type IV pilus assembly protein PilN
MSNSMYKVNLLPPRLQHEELVDIRRLLLTSLIAVLVLVVLGAGVSFVISDIVVHQEIASAIQQLTSLQPTVAMVQNMQNQTRLMLSTDNDYRSLLNRQMTWSGLIYDLNDIAPTDLWLVELDMTNADLSKNPEAAGNGSGSAPGSNMNAVVRSNAQNGSEPVPYPNVVTIKGMAGSVTSIGIFVQNLNRLPYFKSVVINTITSQAAGSQANNPQVPNSQAEGTSFEITAYLK